MIVLFYIPPSLTFLSCLSFLLDTHLTLICSFCVCMCVWQRSGGGWEAGGREELKWHLVTGWQPQGEMWHFHPWQVSTSSPHQLLDPHAGWKKHTQAHFTTKNRMHIQYTQKQVAQYGTVSLGKQRTSFSKDFLRPNIYQYTWASDWASVLLSPWFCKISIFLTIISLWWLGSAV